MLSFRKRAILFKVEVTPGTDPVPTGGANAILVGDDLTVKVVVKMADRKNLQSFRGHAANVPVGTEMQIAFSVEAQASGALGTAPAFGPLLKCCDMAETVNASTSVVYNPAASGSSGTIYYYLDGIRYKALYCKGDFELAMTPQGIPYFKFTFTGLYGGVADAALPSQTLTGFKTPLAVNYTNTSAFALHSYSGVLYDHSIKMNNMVVHRDLVGAEDVVLVDRGPTGNIEIEMPLVATKDLFPIVRAGTAGALTILHGVTAGYKLQVDAANVQLESPEEGDRDGVATLKFGLRFMAGSSGNDEVTLTFI